ncbi:hypothetical protein JCM8097_000469 [Rhodosporidiobolus ruineniae]
MATAQDPLEPTQLVELAKQLVSPTASLSSPPQALALLIHAVHSQLAFRLVEPQPHTSTTHSDTPSDSSATQPGEPTAPDSPPHPNRLPSTWPQQGQELKFKYKHDQSSLEFVISVVELGGRALIAGVAVDNPRSSSFDLLLTDYLSPTSLSPSSPLSVASLAADGCPPFAAPHRLKDFILLYRLNVLQTLMPGLNKDGYSEVSQRDLASASSGGGSSSAGAAGGPAPRHPVGGTGPYLPDRGGPLGLFPPSRPHNPSSPSSSFDPPPPARPRQPENDPLRIPGSGGGGGRGPLAEIGRRDLDPLGGMGGTFGGGFGGGGFPGGGGFGGLGGGFGGGFGGLGGGGDGGGMFMGPNHPLFRDRFGPGSDVVGGGDGGGGGGRRWGGDGYLPEGGAPPGARFDPVGPVNGPPGGSGLGVGPGQAGFHPGPGGGNGGGQGQGPAPGQGQGQGGRVHPDLERPGRSSDYDAMFG